MPRVMFNQRPFGLQGSNSRDVWICVLCPGAGPVFSSPNPARARVTSPPSLPLPSPAQPRHTAQPLETQPCVYQVSSQRRDTAVEGAVTVPSCHRDGWPRQEKRRRTRCTRPARRAPGEAGGHKKRTFACPKRLLATCSRLAAGGETTSRGPFQPLPKSLPGSGHHLAAWHCWEGSGRAAPLCPLADSRGLPEL